MKVEHVLHRLWTNSESKLERDDEKRLWQLLQDFIQRNGGLDADAADYDIRGGEKRLEDIKPSPKGILSRILARVAGD